MYPEIMVIPMREELTRLGIQELQHGRRGRSRHTQPARHDYGGGELDLRMRRRSNASRGARGTAALQPSGKIVQRLCRSGQRGHRPGTLLFCGISAVFTVDCACCATAKLVHMMQRSDIEHREAVGHCRRAEKRIRQVLRQTRPGLTQARVGAEPVLS